MTRPSGIVLAGGASRRFGRPKMVESYRGHPLFHQAVLALDEVCAAVVVVLGPDDPEPPPPRAASVKYVRDAVAHRGPLAGVLTGLRAVDTRYAIVAGGDMPGVKSSLVALMATLAEREGRSVVLSDGQRARPLPAVIDVGSARVRAEELLEGGDRRLRSLIAALEPRVLTPEEWGTVDRAGDWQIDVDSATDLPSDGPDR